MTQHQKTPDVTSTPSAPAPRGNSVAGYAAKQAKAAIDRIFASPMENVKIRDLPTKKERLLAIADAIEREELVKDGIGFNMGPYYADLRRFSPDSEEQRRFGDKLGHTCETVACIAGWASLMDDPSIHGTEAIEDRATKILGLTKQEAHALFYASNSGTSREDITAQHAIATLRDFAATGSIHWEHFDKDGKRKAL